MTAPADEKEMELETELDDPEGEEEEDQKKPKMNPKKLAAIIGLAALGLIIVITPVAYFMGWIHSALGIEQEESMAQIELGQPIVFEIPQIKADLKTGTCRAPFLRLTFNVQLSSDDQKRIEMGKDKIVEQVLLHLRDQERQDLGGKEGANKLRFDLVNIVNNVIAPSRIHGITFKEFVLQ